MPGDSQTHTNAWRLLQIIIAVVHMKMAFTSLILVAVIQAIQFSCHSQGQGL